MSYLLLNCMCLSGGKKLKAGPNYGRYYIMLVLPVYYVYFMTREIDSLHFHSLINTNYLVPGLYLIVFFIMAELSPL